jgi:hypothetical protein
MWGFHAGFLETSPSLDTIRQLPIMSVGCIGANGKDKGGALGRQNAEYEHNVS